MSQSMTFTATGDSFITRRLPDPNDDMVSDVAELIHKGEFRFTNLEVTVHDFEGFPSATSGGTWAMTSPQSLNDIKRYGFNALAWANNHTLDYSYGGLEATTRYLNEHDFVHAGVGKNLADASAPKYIDCPSGRVALIATTSTFHESWVAGEQRSDMEGRPGINPLRYHTSYKVTEKQMEQLKNIASATHINATNDLDIKEGFKLPPEDDSFVFGSHTFTIGSEPKEVTYPAKIDEERILKSISEAKRQADYIIVSIHSHEMEKNYKDKAPQFLKDFSRACIDEGAHAVIGHGPHILRGIEIYQERPIFYSLGNFIFQNSTITHLPHDFYTKYQLDFSHNMADALDVRSENGQKGLGTNPKVWESIIPFWKMKDGKLEELKLYPIDLGYGQPRYKQGWPIRTKSNHALENIKELSKSFGTNIDIENNIGIIR